MALGRIGGQPASLGTVDMAGMCSGGASRRRARLLQQPEQLCVLLLFVTWFSCAPSGDAQRTQPLQDCSYIEVVKPEVTMRGVGGEWARRRSEVHRCRIGNAVTQR